jgi:hypothetical protein
MVQIPFILLVTAAIWGANTTATSFRLYFNVVGNFTCKQKIPTPDIQGSEKDDYYYSSDNPGDSQDSGSVPEPGQPLLAIWTNDACNLTLADSACGKHIEPSPLGTGSLSE